MLIKIPATKEGLGSIAAATAAGVSVNVTLIFSLERYDEVMDAYLTGLEQAKAAGIDLSTIHSVASFFVSRVDTEIDKRLDKIGTEEAQALRGKAGIANARLAYEHYEKVFGSDRWEALEAAGAHQAAAAVGLDRRQGPGLRRHDVRRRPGRAEHGQHDARGHAERGRRPRPDRAATRSRGTYAEAQQVLDGWPRSASTTTTSSSCSRSRACRSSRTPGRSCSKVCSASSTPAKR